MEEISKIDASVNTTNEFVGKIQDSVNLITEIASETSLLMELTGIGTSC